MLRTGELENKELEQRDARFRKLKDWEIELSALAQMLQDAAHENRWRVRYGYMGATYPYRPMTALVMMIDDDSRLVRFVRDEHGIVGLFEFREPQRFTDRHHAFEAAVKRRIARQNFR